MASSAQMRDVLHQACDKLARAVRLAVIGLAVVMLVALSLQVVMRYGFGRALSWSEELAVTCFSWSMLLAVALGVRDGIHVRMDLLVDRLPGALRLTLEKLVALATAFAGGFIAWSGARYVAQTGDSVSAAMAYPISWLYLCAPVGGALIAVFALEHLLAGPAPVTQPAEIA
ncbi:MAG TPA: TRAP transporter small permease [Ramlibacter sp.]|nr:TRAP transporter small permease [Ramlibacter sp.]